MFCLWCFSLLQTVFSGVYFGINLYEYALFFASVFGFLVAGKIVNFFSQNYLKRLAAKTKSEFDDLLIDASQKPVLFLSLLAGVFIGLHFLTIPPEWRQTATNIIGLLFIVDLAWFLVNIVDGAVVHFIVPFTRKTKSRMDDQLVPLFSKGLKAIIIIMAFVVILDNFGYDITAIIAGLGIGGLALAFAAQQTIADAFGGLSIFASKPFFVGDKVSVEGVTGTVEQIGIRHTRIRDFEGRLNIISNSKISAAVVKNLTTEPGRKVRINLGVTYGTSVEKLRQGMEIIKKILAGQKNVDPDSVLVGFNEFKDFSLNIYVEFFIKETEYRKILEAQNNVGLAVKEQFEKNKIEFAFPTSTVYMYQKKE